MKKIIYAFILFFCYPAIAQIKGTITDLNENPLSFVSIYLDNTITGTTSNDDGYYELDLNKTGDYIVVFQFLGYKTIKKAISINQFPFEVNVILENETIVLNEISIDNVENPANTIIRNAIDNKEKNTNTFKKYTANFYSRGIFKIKNAPKKILGQRLGDFGGGLDSTRTGIIYLSETISKISYQKKPNKFKEKIIASKVSGSDNGISFNRAEEANFDFYQEGVSIADNNLVSPISSAAFGYYQYQLEGSFYDKNNRLINKIKVIPKREGDRVFSGFIYIVEEDWALYGIDLVATGKQVGIPIIDLLKFKQDYNFSEINNAWIKISQTIDFKFGIFGVNIDGRFSAAYSNYNFSPNFKKQTFTTEVLSFENGATEKDSFFWSQLRPVPLTNEEVRDYTLKDSIQVIRKSKKYLDSIDQKNNQFKLGTLISGYTYSNSYKKWSLSIDSPIKSLAYNTVQGWNVSTGIKYFKRLDDKGKWIRAGINITYGLSEKKGRPMFYFTKKWNNLQRPTFTFSIGNITKQFNDNDPISRFHNTVYSLFFKENYLKIYEKKFSKVSYSKEVINGIYLTSSLEYAQRNPLFNTTKHVIFGRNFPFLSNNPFDPTNFSSSFATHTISSLNIGATFVFNQKYVSYPNGKFTIGNSKYPRISLNFRKNFGASKSIYNSNLITAKIRQSLTQGNFGNANYYIRLGAFLQKKDIPFMDYLHVNGNQIDLLQSNSINGLLYYYQFSTNDKYAEMHYEHNFKGALLNRIPLINKLNFHLFTGVKGLFFGGRKPYYEYSIGLDNIGVKKWRFLKVNYFQSVFNGTTKNGVLFGVSF